MMNPEPVKPLVLLVGATGSVGTQVAQKLIARGLRPRALVRNPQAAIERLGNRLDYVQGDLEDSASLPPALEGVEVAYLATAGSSERTIEQEINFITAAEATELPRLVKLSALGAKLESFGVFQAHGEVEAKLAKSGIPATLLQPQIFMSNFLRDAESVKGGNLYSPAGDGRLAFIDSEDVADVAVAALLDPGHAGHTYQLTGPEALTYNEVAATFARVLGRPVRHVQLNDNHFRAGLQGAGASDWLIGTLVQFYSLVRQGEIEVVTHTVQEVLGRPPHRLEQWIEANRSAFLEPLDGLSVHSRDKSIITSNTD